MTGDNVPWLRPDAQVRRWRGLRLVAGLPLLAVPVDLLLANWVSDSSSRKAVCGAPLPGYQKALAQLAPVVFIVIGLAATVAGVVTLVRGRRHHAPAERFAGRTTLTLAVPALVTSVLAAVPALFAVGLSTYCF